MYISRHEMYPTHSSDNIEADSVAEGEWKRSYGGKLITCEAEPCVVVAIHDPERYVGYLGHFTVETSPYSRLPFMRMLREVRADKPTEGIEAWVSGASRLNVPGEDAQDIAVYNEQLDETKADTIEKLVLLGISSPEQDWLDENEKIVSALFNCASGSIDYVVDKID